MIKVSVIKKHYQVKVGAKNIVTSCDPATVTATNSDSTVIGTATVPSGGTGNIPIADSEIRRSDASLIVSLPATEPATIQDSVVQINQVDGTPISTNNVMAATNVTLLVPNPLTLQQTIDGNTSANIATAINNATDSDKPDDVFLGTVANISNATLNTGLTIDQRNVLSNLRLGKTGETISYLANDDGALQEGRGDDWLNESLDGGVTTFPRFVIVTGYPNLFHDLRTGLTWRNIIVGAKTDVQYANEASSLTDGGLPAGSWRVPNESEVHSILRFSALPLDYPPINYNQVTSGVIRFITSNAGYSGASANMFVYFINAISGVATGYNVSTSTGRASTGGGDSLKRVLYVTNTKNFL